MKTFMGEDFLLGNDTAKRLFEVAKKQPIFDYHCHLSPRAIYENKPFEDIAQLWLGGDHYKWRVMRSSGIDEKYITGESTWQEKFQAWASVLPECIGNPLYHWSHLELQRFFGIETPLSAKTADAIWKQANAKIAAGGFSPRELIKNSNVTVLCTTDDPVDSLKYHALLAEDKAFGVRVLPAFRPDKALNIQAPGFRGWVEKLEQAADLPVRSFDAFREALTLRLEYFKSLGCVASDHAFVYVPFAPVNDAQADAIFQKALHGEPVNATEADQFRTVLMFHLCAQYHRLHIAMELHLNSMRDNNARMFGIMGPDTGFDSVDDALIARPLSHFLNNLEVHGILPKTIFFTLNPKDNYVLGSMTGNFQSPETAGKMQLGAAWWMSDHIDGMRRQMIDLANLGVLGRFIGMLTDSRSFLSYPRHEYFRRILCNLIGELVENGEYPDDREQLDTLVENISYKNALSYFG